MITPQLDRLHSQLLTSGLSQKNQPLYQVIEQLIGAVRQGFNEVEGSIISLTPSGGSPSGANTSVVGDMPLWRTQEFSDTGPLVIVGPKGDIGSVGPMGPPGMDGCCGEVNLGPTLAPQFGIGSIILPGTVGSVLFIGAGNKLAQDNSGFFFDDTNNYVGLGTTAPGGTLDATGNFTADQAFVARLSARHSTATAGTVYGMQLNVRMLHNAGTQNAIQGFFSQAFYDGTSAAVPAITAMTSFFSRVALSGTPTGTISVARGFEIDSLANFGGGGTAVTVTSINGGIVRNQGAGTGAGGLTITNCAGWMIADQTGPAGNIVNLAVGTLSIPTGSWSIYNSSTKNNHFAGPLYMGHTTTWATGTNFISFADGTVPGTPAANTAAIYSNDVGGTVMMFNIDEAGNITRLMHINRALGGGAAATLGTIGGAGPTAAAQNSWMEYQVNGTTYWIPVWV